MPKRSRKEIADPNLSAANVLKQMFKEAEVEGKIRWPWRWDAVEG